MAAMAVASVFRHIQHFVRWLAGGRCEIDPRPGSDEEGDRGEEKEQKERKAWEKMIQRRRGTINLRVAVLFFFLHAVLAFPVACFIPAMAQQFLAESSQSLGSDLVVPETPLHLQPSPSPVVQRRRQAHVIDSEEEEEEQGADEDDGELPRRKRRRLVAMNCTGWNS